MIARDQLGIPTRARRTSGAVRGACWKTTPTISTRTLRAGTCPRCSTARSRRSTPRCSDGWATPETELVGRRRFSDLLTVGGKIYHETHFAPLLAMQGDVGGIALELRTKAGDRLPVLVTSTVKIGADGQPLLIRTTIFDARDRRAYEQELLRARQVAEHERERLQLLVLGLQRSLLPVGAADATRMETAAYYHMASQDEVGGDFYDLFPLGDGRWGFFLGDVCGKGLDAASVTSLTRYTLRAAAVYDPDPAAVLRNLNTVLYQEYLADTHRYCTVVFGVLDAASRPVTSPPSPAEATRLR